MSSVTALGYDDTCRFCIDSINETKYFNEVFHVNLDYKNLKNIDSQLKKISTHKKHHKKICIFLSIAEPITIMPPDSVGLEFFKFKELLLKNNIFDIDILVTGFMSNPVQHSIDYLRGNNYGWRFEILRGDIPMFQRTTDIKVDYDIGIDNCKYRISHLNFTHRMHRQLYSKFLIKEGLCNDNMIAINLPSKLSTTNENKFNSDSIDINASKYDDWFYSQFLLDLWRDVEINAYTHTDIPPKRNDGVSQQFLQKAGLNVVSETLFNYPHFFITEKTLQAIISKRPFIMIGPHHSLKNLQQHGYKTFSHIIDESYDREKDPNTRLEMIMKLTKDYNKKSIGAVKADIENSKEILLHNYKLLISNFIDLKNNLNDSIINYVNKCKNTSPR